ncbi:MAG: hypothetical protein QJR05_12040, partial [Thermoanaerobacterium sp.]|nr:hypothetical protein [Thermoanaerobacterium sp.]
MLWQDKYHQEFSHFYPFVIYYKQMKFNINQYSYPYYLFSKGADLMCGIAGWVSFQEELLNRKN